MLRVKPDKLCTVYIIDDYIISLAFRFLNLSMETKDRRIILKTEKSIGKWLEIEMRCAILGFECDVGN